MMKFRDDDVQCFVNKDKRMVTIRINRVSEYIISDFMKQFCGATLIELDDWCCMDKIHTRMRKLGIFDDGNAVLGTAYCHEDDKFDTRKGRRIAFRRALSKCLKAKRTMFNYMLNNIGEFMIQMKSYMDNLDYRIETLHQNKVNDER